MAGYPLASEPGAVTERLWRLCKDHRVVEAMTRTRADSASVVLTIDYNGETRSTSRRWFLLQRGVSSGLIVRGR